MGSWCAETGEYVSEPWPKDILLESETYVTKRLSVPFLESYSILTAILTLGKDNNNVQVYTDSKTAVDICSNRWCKTNDTLNKYIAFFDVECAQRGILMQVKWKRRGENYGAHHLSQGKENLAKRYAQITHKKEAVRMKELS